MIPNAQAWFACGERVGYDPKARARVRTEDASLRIFTRRQEILTQAVSFLPGFPDGSIGWAKVRPDLPNAAEIACGPHRDRSRAHISLRKRLVSLTACPHTHDGNKTDHCVCRGYLRLDSLRKSLKVAEFIKRNLVLLGEGVDTRK